MPMILLMAMMDMAMNNESCPPHNIRDSTSRPNWSVPSKCVALTSCNRAPKFVSLGSKGAN